MILPMRLREIHQPAERSMLFPGEEPAALATSCVHDGYPWPCPTIQLAIESLDENASIPCAACRRPLRYGERHSGLACAWRCWRSWRKTGMDPVTRHLMETTPPDQVTVFENKRDNDDG